MFKLQHVLLLVAILNGLKCIVAEPQRSLINYGEYYDVDGDDDDEEYVPVSPCNVVRPGDPDLTTYDVISSYRFDEFRYERQGVQQIAGSMGYQTAYHFEEYSNMTIESTKAFPKGVPDEFSFECTFRVPQQQPPNEWYLFQLTDYQYESQLSVTLNPIYNTIDFSVPKYDGSIQTVTFEETEIFDRSWHKVMLGVTQDAVRLWVDCKPVPDRSGSLRAPLDVRGPIDSSEGVFSVARDCKTRQTVPIDLQWMIFSCDVEKPTRTDCREVPQYAIAPKGRVQQEPTSQKPPYNPDSFINLNITEWRPSPRPENFEDSTIKPPNFTFETTSTQRPWFISSTPAALQGQELVCPQQCPRGPPGPPGPPGQPGLMGAPGMPASGFGRSDAPLQKGEKGERGFTGTPGRDGVKGETGAAGRDGFVGEPGPPGPPGLPGKPGLILGADEQLESVPGAPGLIGLPGVPGEPGLPGAIGHPGLPGAPGVPGQPGQTGLLGEKGERGLPGLDGAMGFPGLVGAIGPEGPVGPPGPQGPPGYSGSVQNEVRTIEEREIRDICMSVVRDYISEISTTLMGPPGPPGRRGVGRPGQPGAQGLQGEQGVRGAQGERGYPGLPGQAGQPGDMGPRGNEGPKGDRGDDGVGREGPMGMPGPEGAPGHGIDGLPGRPGERGDMGRPGEPGQRGPPGEAGICPDCAAYQAAYAYPLLLAQQQQSNKGPQNYYNKGPQNYYNKGQ